MKEINVEIKTCKNCGEAMQLWVDGKLTLSGDQYHDKIWYRIDGFVAGLEYVLAKQNVKINKIKSDFECNFACND